VNLRNFFSGNIEKDQLLSFLKVDESYEAIVTKVNDKARLIFFSIGGVSGIISYDGFKWAHEREISEKKNLLPYITKPSTIVSPGDVILVNIKKKNTGVWPHIYSSYRESLSTSKSTRLQKKVELLKNESYLYATLDQKPEAQAALISLSPETGEILSLVGGTNYIDSKFNRAIQSKRQPGSSFKPILFAVGLEHGHTPASILLDAPEALAGVDERLNWKPRNYDGIFKGPITYRNALEQSRNVPTIKLAEKLGVETILDFTKRIGFNAKLDEDLSLALGSFGVSLLDIVSTYAIFPAGGKMIKPRAIISVVDRDGKSYSVNNIVKDDEAIEDEESVTDLEETKEVDTEEVIDVNPFHVNLDEQQVYDKRLSYIMCNLLKGTIQNGTGRGARRVSNFIGGKTGTTNSYVDAWFIGFSPNVVTGVWTGFDDNKTLGWAETGAKSALPIWKEYMKNALLVYGEQDFVMPAGITNIQINKETGKTASQGERQLNFTESFVEGFEPGAEAPEITEEPVPSNQILEDDDYYSER
ncbi:MAG: penicillin-binding transpeptidase domain-containing protein, partial [Bdellovibrionales bacterium]|nr:penicillin-binding transpeptidase domain-containing protein [Bdellovibrionales bacterium]